MCHEPLQAEVARLQAALDAASATHEAATAAMRRELQHAHDSAVERTRTLEGTIAELKAAHSAALTKVRSAHEANVKAERDARVEAERQRDVAVERARADSEGVRAEAERQQQMHASAMMSEGARAEAERQKQMHASALARVEATHAASVAEAAERVRALETALAPLMTSDGLLMASENLRMVFLIRCARSRRRSRSSAPRATCSRRHSSARTQRPSSPSASCASSCRSR